LTQSSVSEQSGLRGFLNQGGLWRLLLVVAVYVVIYLGAGWVGSQFSGDFKGDDLLSSVGSVFFQLTLALIVGAVVLVLFTSYMGWNADLFGRQRVYRSWWMWIAPVVVGLPILFRVLSIDWGRHGVDVVALVFATGLLIGFCEELLTRGIGVKMLRDAGHSEWAVAALSSLVFALLHANNLFSGQAVSTVGFTIIYTFAFGVLMYLTMRVTGFLIAAIVMHALTDPTTILATGGIDEITSDASGSGLVALVGVSTFLLIFTGYVLLIFIRGRADEPAQPALST
jgi:membrane protease YdiL (CAAX protease family)